MGLKNMDVTIAVGFDNHRLIVLRDEHVPRRHSVERQTASSPKHGVFDPVPVGQHLARDFDICVRMTGDTLKRRLSAIIVYAARSQSSARQIDRDSDSPI